MLLQLKLLFTPFDPLSIQRPRDAHVKAPEQPRDDNQQFQVRHILRHTIPRSQRKWLKRPPHPLKPPLLLTISPAVQHPSLRPVRKRVREDGFVMVHDKDGHADVDARRDVDSGDGSAVRRTGLAPQSGADGRRHAQRLVDAGAEVGQAAELGAVLDGGDVLEGVPDVGDEALVAGGVAGEVEERGREGCGGGVGARDEEEAALGEELWWGEALSRVWVLGVYEEGKDIVVIGYGVL